MEKTHSWNWNNKFGHVIRIVQMTSRFQNFRLCSSLFSSIKLVKTVFPVFTFWYTSHNVLFLLDHSNERQT